MNSPLSRSMSHSDRGKLGARKRWGPPRVVRLDALDPEQRSRVVNLVRTMERNNGYEAPSDDE